MSLYHINPIICPEGVAFYERGEGCYLELQVEKINHCRWLVGCFWFNGPLRQFFSLYWDFCQREGERGEKG